MRRFSKGRNLFGLRAQRLIQSHQHIRPEPTRHRGTRQGDQICNLADAKPLERDDVLLVQPQCLDW